MEKIHLTPDDLQQLSLLGISEEQVRAQISIFQEGTHFLTLDRPCTIGDGIVIVPGSAMNNFLEQQYRASQAGRCTKFVPASGAATRMFQSLLWFRNEQCSCRREDAVCLADSGPSVAREILMFMDRIGDFPFLGELRSCMKQHGLDADALIGDGEFSQIVDYLLADFGLSYASYPKALLAFHRYPDTVRTALEEHLVEAVHYVRDAGNRCRVHFTASPEHEAAFRRSIDVLKPIYEEMFQVCYEVALTFQQPRTDTIAVDLNNQPFRDDSGRLVFRPGGHGALIENLNDLGGDIVYIKNIDNVVPDRLKPETNLWKKLLGGYLIETEEKIFAYLKALTTGRYTRDTLDEALTFAEHILHLRPAATSLSDEQKKAFLIQRLNRPIRVCGMVRNVGEPGGGPFWVRDDDGSLSLQIVESAQVNMAAADQRDIWNAATHFNPVDLVCSVRNFNGEPFNLHQYVDHRAVFISRKSKDGRELKALELPGLWNGAMGNWNTVFVEVPLITFNPVKTINDLLREEHRAL